MTCMYAHAGLDTHVLLGNSDTTGGITIVCGVTHAYTHARYKTHAQLFVTNNT